MRTSMRSVTFHSFPAIFTITIFVLSYSKVAYIEANGSGFSVDLIHRDSPISPFYNPPLNPSHRMIGALQRSFNRANHLKSKGRSSGTQNFQTEVIPDHGEFLMKISFGSPPFEVLAITDTGTDLTWIQCQPCTPCYKQIGPIFDPRKSSTYKSLPCVSPQCRHISKHTCSKTNGTCQYHDSYGDGSYSGGDVAYEMVTLGSKHLPNIIFGCGSSNGGIFSPTGSGIVGLGRGELSLISQIGSSIHSKFSHCFVPNPQLNDITTKTSKMYFGDVVSSPGAVSTPIIFRKLPDIYYYLSLEGISIGNKRLDLSKSSSTSTSTSSSDALQGNIIIDSGTTLTFLPSDLYTRIESVVKSAVKLKPIPDPQRIMNLCYLSSQLSNVPVPDITVHFKGADVKLTRLNTIVQTSENSSCLAFYPTTDLPIYGNLAQMNFFVTYDLANKKLSFTPSDCTKQ